MTERVERCRKCHSEDLSMQWHESRWDCSYAAKKHEAYEPSGEHLHRTCRNCGFTWKEKTRDVEVPA